MHVLFVLLLSFSLCQSMPMQAEAQPENASSESVFIIPPESIIKPMFTSSTTTSAVVTPKMPKTFLSRFLDFVQQCADEIKAHPFMSSSCGAFVSYIIGDLLTLLVKRIKHIRSRRDLSSLHNETVQIVESGEN
jgi:hypothetical protein